MTLSNASVRVFGLVPAAGMSRRMGRPKQTLPYRDATFVGSVVRTLLAAGAEGVVVVTRAELRDQLGLPKNDCVIVAYNHSVGGEMIESVQIGLAALADRAASGAPDTPTRAAESPESTSRLAGPSDADGILVVPADMPALSVEACRQCLRAYAADPSRIVIAAFEGKAGHPLIFPFGLRAELHDLKGGLRALPARFPRRVLKVETADPTVVRDVNTPADYLRLPRAAQDP